MTPQQQLDGFIDRFTPEVRLIIKSIAAKQRPRRP